MTDTSKERCEKLVRVLIYGAEGYGHNLSTLREAADLITALQEGRNTLQTLCHTKTKEMGEQDRLITALQERVAEVEENRADLAEALAEALEVVRWYADLPQEWKIKVAGDLKYGDLHLLGERARALLAKHGGPK